MYKRLLAHGRALHDCREFDSVGLLLLESMFAALDRPLRDGRSAAVPLRGTIHFRPDNEYRRLLCLEAGVSSPTEPPLSLPSLTAWRWIASKGCPVVIDVKAQLLHVYEGGDPRTFHGDSSVVRLSSGETCQRLAARDADCVLVYPLRRPGGIVDGMVSLELHGSDVLGEETHAECGSVLELMVDLAAPHLACLPGAPSQQAASCDEYLPVVGASTAPLVELLRVFSQLDETLLITGPTGVGKSRLARYCHAHSTRRNRPFVTLDLMACPESLQMPQLCGAKKGAYTGADRDMPGAIQRAEGGTLFIDEIDKLTLNVQAGLLRFIEDRVYRPIGDCGDDRKADVRLIVGTTANLKDEVQQGRFREDLYYRVAVLFVRVPPLAARSDEIRSWATYMLNRCNDSAGSGLSARRVELADDAIGALKGHSWPGNLRQLDNVVRRAYAYSLLECGTAGDPVQVSRDSLARAMHDELDDQSSTKEVSLQEAMKAAATAFAELALQRADSARPLPLALADAFRAMVLDATLQKCEKDKDAALQALGMGSIVRDRNHHRMIKRELELLQRFYAELIPGKPAVSAAVDDTQ